MGFPFMIEYKIVMMKTLNKLSSMGNNLLIEILVTLSQSFEERGKQANNDKEGN